MCSIKGQSENRSNQTNGLVGVSGLPKSGASHLGYEQPTSRNVHRFVHTVRPLVALKPTAGAANPTMDARPCTGAGPGANAAATRMPSHLGPLLGGTTIARILGWVHAAASED